MDGSIKILIIEDDEDDFIILRQLLYEIERHKFDLTWVKDYTESMDHLKNGIHDVCLMDYRLGGYDCLTLLKELQDLHFKPPIIILTGYGDRGVDLEAMRLGAADYLEKFGLSSDKLERSIRYAIDRSITLKALIESKAKLRILSVKILEAQEAERKSIAKELHDSLGSYLTAIKYALEKRLSDERGVEALNDTSLEQIISMVRETMEETRRISSNLRPSILDDLGLITAIRYICREHQEIYKGIYVETKFKIEESDVPESLKIIIYRVLQEALNNIVKHSNATRIEISLERNNHGIEFVIEDNGTGFDVEQVHSRQEGQGGMGLIDMSERVALSNGQFDISSTRGHRTTVRAFWPISQQDPSQ